MTTQAQQAPLQPCVSDMLRSSQDMKQQLDKMMTELEQFGKVLTRTKLQPSPLHCRVKQPVIQQVYVDDTIEVVVQ